MQMLPGEKEVEVSFDIQMCVQNVQVNYCLYFGLNI